MPIRINLLAEAQAAEEMRRKDPVKRAILAGVGCVIAMAAVSLFIQSQVIAINLQSNKLAKDINGITNNYSIVMLDKDRLELVRRNTRGLDILASERFLNGNLLNALQKVYVDNVQLVHVRTAHSYEQTEEIRVKTNIVKITKYASSAEKIIVVVEARDSSANPGDQVAKFKETLGGTDYFKTLLGTNNVMRLANLSPPQLNPESGRQIVQFTLESTVPEKVRMDIASPTRYGTPASATKGAVKKAASDAVDL